MKKRLLFVLTSTILLLSNVCLNAQAIVLDGVDDFVNCGNDASLTTFTNNQITLEAWVNASAWKDEVYQGCVITKDQQNVDLDNNLTDDGYMIRIGKNGTVNFNIGGSGAEEGWNEINSEEEAISLNEWHHIAGVYDGTSMIIYIDGIETVKEDKVFTIGVAPDYPLIIGDSPQWPGRYFAGTIDEVRVWNVARTAAQIFGGSGTEIAATDGVGLVAYYKMNTGSGTTAVDQNELNDGIFGGSVDSVDYQPTWVSAGAPVTAVSDWIVSIKGEKSELFSLGNCYPNPTSGTTFIPVELKQAGMVTITVCNVLGQEAKVVKNEQMLSGAHKASFDVDGLNAGLYFVQLSVDGESVASSKLYVK